MRPRGVRLAVVLAALLGLAVAAAALLLHRAALAALADQPAIVRDGVHDALLGWSIGIVVLATMLGGWAGLRLSASLEALTRSLLARSEGDVAHPIPATRLADVRALGLAADRVSGQLTRHAGRLERQRQELALLVDSVSEGLLHIDAGGRLAFINPGARTLLALPGNAVGQPVSLLVRELELRRVVERALAGERIQGVETTLGERHLLISAQPLEGDDAADGVVVAVADLTALRRLESVRRDFVANVSHELKTPLTAIRGYIETVLADDVPEETRRQFLEVAQRNAERLQRIVDDLLDLSRIESGGWIPELQQLNAGALVRDVWLTCAERAERAGIVFQAPAGDIRVLADPSGLRQVLGNLFDNAVRHTPAHGRIEVRLQRIAASSADRHDWVAFEVRDTGTGIPGSALPRIFERFYRVDPARSRAEGGTGLGLAIVRHLVERMGGDVAAASELGKGTTIRFRLPAAS